MPAPGDPACARLAGEAIDQTLPERNDAMSAPMSREAALRIGLAARQVPGAEARALARFLLEKLEVPVTEAKLAQITVEDLHVAFGGEEGSAVPDEISDVLKAAVRILWGQGVQGSDLPVPEAYADGDMPGSIRVAMASNRDENLDGHFGSCERFLVYQVSPAELRLVAVRSALEADEAEDRNAARAQVIGDCQIAYVQSIGGPAAAKVVRAGVHPVKLPAGGPARQVLAQLQQRLTTPPPWLAQVMGVPAASLAKYAGELEEEVE